MKGLIKHIALYFIAGLLGLVLILPSAAAAAGDTGNWWEVTPEEETPSPYYDSILYSEIAPMLKKLQDASDRIDVKVMGQSAGGRDIFLVIIAAKGETQGRLGYYKQIRRLMRSNPSKALELLETKDVKVPVFINGSIHGDEYPGTDACMRLIRRLAYYNSEEITRLLDNVVLLINVVQNPDGRVLGTRENAANFDLNRDFLTLSQPESRATVKLVKDWNPMVFLDLHGFVNPMLIEPCAPPHLANAEYDLFLKWALPQAKAMEAELKAQTGYDSVIPYRDWPQEYAWDAWSPSYAGVYSILPGAYGHTIETPYRDERGVDAHYAAVWGALNFIVENKKEMLKDQIEIYKRGLSAEEQQPIPDELLEQTEHDQYNELTVKEFPAAYVLPMEAPLQKNPHAASDLIGFLLDHGVEVTKSKAGFSLDGTDYPEGTCIVWMNQAKRSLANTILEDGPDLSDVEGGLVFYSPPTSWSLPLLWGVSRVVVEGALEVETAGVYAAPGMEGSVSDEADHVAWGPDNIEAYRAANDLLGRGISVYRLTEASGEGDARMEAGTFMVPTEAANALLTEVAGTFGLEMTGVADLPESALLLSEPKIAIVNDFALAHALKEMGFEFETLSEDEVVAGVSMSEYDLFINSDIYWTVDPDAPNARWLTGLEEGGKTAMNAFFQAGGDYIGINGAGIAFGVDGGLADVEYTQGDGSGIIRAAYDGESPVGAGFGDDEHAFIASPIWFTRLGEDVTSVARAAEGDFFVSGYWPLWAGSGAAGMPIVIHGENGDRDTVLVGADLLFKGLPRNSFRVLANAVFSCQER